ncbi:MAG: lamin tail domain-containing protein, partial [Candidatus Sigynarchaeota archaeon]
NHADVRMMEVSRTTLSITDRRMAVWMVYTTGSYAYYWKTYPFTGSPGYIVSYASSVNALEIADMDYDGTPEICTVGYYSYSGTGNVYGTTHVMQWNGTDFILKYRTLFYDYNNFKTQYLDMAIENVDYDTIQEIFVGGTTSASQKRNHDFSAVVNPLTNNTQSSTTAEGYAAEDLGHIVINEVCTGADAIEFYNQGPTQVMTGWTVAIYHNNAYYNTYTFPAGFTFNSETFLILDEVNSTNNQTHQYIGWNIPWTSAPMAVGIINPAGQCVDWFQASNYAGPVPSGTKWTQNIIMMLTANAYAYRMSYWDNDRASDFLNSTTGTLGSRNPGQPIVLPSSKTVTTEICDVDADGVLEMLSLVYSNGYGWQIYIYNKTSIIDKRSPEIISLGNAINLVGGNVTRFHDNFDSTAIRWEQITGLWHYTGYWSIWPDSYRSYGQSMWFGREDTGTFNTGARARGSIVSMAIDLTGVTSAFLEFYHWRNGENGTYDYSFVYVSIDKVTWSPPIYQANGYIAPWQKVVLDLSAYAGVRSLWLNFTFDSMDGALNNYRGWLVDDVKVYTNVQTVTHEFLVRDQSAITLSRNNTGVMNTYTFSPVPWSSYTRDSPWQYIGTDTIYLNALVPNAFTSVVYTASDGLGNVNSISVPFYYDTKVPDVSILAPGNGSYICTRPSFTVVISESSLALSWYEVYIPGGSGGVGAPGTFLGPYYFTANGSMDTSVWDSLPQNVPIYWRFFARDKAGNVGGATIQFVKSTIEITTVLSTHAIVRGQLVLVNVEIFNHAANDAIINDVGLTFRNAGSDYSIDYIVYKTFSIPNSIQAGRSEFFEFEVTAQDYATCGLNITIDAWVTGSDILTGEALYRGFSNVKSWWIVQSKADVRVTQILDVIGRGIYVEGETFQVRIEYTNYGGTGAMVDATLTFGGYTFLSAGDAMAVYVPAAGIEYQTFIVTVMAGATNAYVSINFTATGVEDISGRLFTVRSMVGPLGINIQGKGNLAIQNIVLVAFRSPAIYVGGESFQIRITYLNSGGTAILGVTSALSSSSGSVTFGTSTSVTVPAFGSASQVFMVYIASGAPNQPAVQIDATATGTEQYTGRGVSDSTTDSNDLDIAIQAQANVQITGIIDRTASSPYIGGESFVIRVAYVNTGGTAAFNLVTSLNFNGYSYASANATSPITIPAKGDTDYKDFLIKLATSATTKTITI